MLVTFRSDWGNVTMFGDVALTLLKMAGQSGTVPSAMLAAAREGYDVIWDKGT